MDYKFESKSIFETLITHISKSIDCNMNTHIPRCDEKIDRI